MIIDLNNFNQSAIRACADWIHARVNKLLSVLSVEFVTMPMSRCVRNKRCPSFELFLPHNKATS